MLKIATWNVNSLRVRLPHVLLWLAEHQPDILALQETKTQDVNFPKAEIEAAGYQVVFSGQKTFNGVAILSRKHQPEEIIMDIPQLNDPQRRILAATINNVRIINLYVPNGESVESAKYEYKLNWLTQMHGYLKQQAEQYSQLVVLGDLNIALHEQDLYAPEQWQGRILFSEPERNALQQWLDLGFKDTFRLHQQESGHYTWWDYRMNSFKRNLGARIDYIFASPMLAKNSIDCLIDKKPREQLQPSDHAPVVAAFNLKE